MVALGRNNYLFAESDGGDHLQLARWEASSRGWAPVGVTNVANGRPAPLTSGLGGSCELINQKFTKVSFQRTESSDFDLWAKCSGLTHDNFDPVFICNASKERVQ